MAVTTAPSRPVSKGEATRERIVEAAAEEASVRGLTAISLQDVANLVGLSKSGIFKHFQSMEAMQLAVLDWTAGRFLTRTWWPSRSDPDPRARLTQVFDAWLDWVAGSETRGGCPLQAASMELDDQPGVLRDFLQAAAARWQGRLRGEFVALRHPPLSEDDADQAFFEMKGFVLAYIEQRRLLEDATARQRAKAAFERLLDRL